MSLYSVLYVCLAVSLYPAIFANPHKQEMKDHYDHIERVADFDCHKPQPRLLTVQELVPFHLTHGKAYFPEVTVLHRCDRYTGSCSSAAYCCGPTEVTNVSLPFKVTFLENIGGHSIGSWTMEHHVFDNHTQCGCDKVLKPAPVPNAHGYSPIYSSQEPPKNFEPSQSGWDSAPTANEQVPSPTYPESTYPGYNSYTSESPYVNLVDYYPTTPEVVSPDFESSPDIDMRSSVF